MAKTAPRSSHLDEPPSVRPPALRQPRHRHDVARLGDDEAGARGGVHLVDRDAESGRPPEPRWIVGQRILRLGHAHRRVAQADRLQIVDRALGFGGRSRRRRRHTPSYDGVDLLRESASWSRTRGVSATGRSKQISSTARASSSPPAPPLLPHLGHRDVDACASRAVHDACSSRSESVVKRFTATTTGTPNCCTFSMCFCRLGSPRSSAPTIFACRVLFLLCAAIELERAHRRNQHRRLGLQACHAALDIEELLGTQVRPESRLGHDDIRRARAPSSSRGCCCSRAQCCRTGPRERRPGPPSSVCTRLGRIASLSSSVMAPDALRSRCADGLRSAPAVEPTMIRPSRCLEVRRGPTRARGSP